MRSLMVALKEHCTVVVARSRAFRPSQARSRVERRATGTDDRYTSSLRGADCREGLPQRTVGLRLFRLLGRDLREFWGFDRDQQGVARNSNSLVAGRGGALYLDKI